jgi:adenine-specific DNA-methyltransferase
MAATISHSTFAVAPNRAAGPSRLSNLEGQRSAAALEAANACADLDRVAMARSFGKRIVAKWWAILTRADRSRLPLREPWAEFGTVPLSASIRELADSLGVAAASLDIESAAYEIGSAYTGALPREHRSAFGVYYTPPVLTARLIDLATHAGVDWARCHVLDPACGGGAFLAPLARRMVEERAGSDAAELIADIARRLRGFEIDPFGAWLSQIALEAVLLTLTRATGERLPIVVDVRDTLQADAPDQLFDLVIGNPPYGRTRLSPPDRERFKRSLYGHANLYGLFTDAALRNAKHGGVIAYVTPTSFLAGEYFKNLRGLLACEAPPVGIDFVASRRGVFDDVLQETLLATYRRGGPRNSVVVHEFSPCNGSRPNVERAGKFAVPRDGSRPWLMPRNAAQSTLVSLLEKTPHRLADWGYGVSTGPLVWNRHKSQLRDRPGTNTFPLIWAEAVAADGQFVWRADKRNHKPYFEALDGDGWLITDRPCVLLQRTTAKEQSRRLIAAPLPANFLREHRAVVIENHLNMVRSTDKRRIVSPEVVAAFLNSAAADRAFRCVSGSVAVSAYELEALPLPDPEHLDELGRLVRRCARRELIELECERIYGAIDG